MAPSRATIAKEGISPEALVHLRSYKYSGVDKSLISKYILQPYWNVCVGLLPLWLAPNMVTLLGFFAILANLVILEIWVPDLLGPAPSWVYFSFALGIWFYSTMDNIDGKQARRTGTSSPLGELFDHGIDSLNCTLASLLELSALGTGPSKLAVVNLLIPCAPMFFSTWETYHTHTLYLGYFNGPTEGLLICCAILVGTGLHGFEIYHVPIATVAPKLLKPLLGTISVLSLWPYMLSAALFVAHIPPCVSNVVQARRKRNLPIMPVFLEWIPFLIYSIACLSWLLSPYTTLLGENGGGGSVNNRLVLFGMTMSFVFGRLTTKIILAHLTKQPFPFWTVLLVPLILGAGLVNLPLVGGPRLSPLAELWYLRTYFVFAGVVYIRWATLVIDSICSYLGIHCLTITPEQMKRLRSKKVT